MLDLLAYVGYCLIFALVVCAIQYRNRYCEVHYCMGVDMRGFKDEWTLPYKVQWIRTRPDYKKCHDPHDIVRLWERRDQVLDSIVDS